jgi:L-gulonolactone oxidase
MTRLNRIITADFNAGIMHVEAGISLDELLRVIVPRGWFVSTTPGTRFVTIGGAVANDVHGKNHHGAGSFGCAVRRLELIRSDGTRVELSASAASPLFRATVGGLGLTGVISTVEFQLTPIRSAYLDVERIPFGHVREFFEINAESVQHFEHTVAWVDCANGRLGRGIMQRARWCTDGDLATHRSSSALSIPSRMPRLVPQRLALKIFNALYYHLNTIGRTRQRVHYAPFFYPLDAVGNWNRLYGWHGFYQYQCLIPAVAAPAAIGEILSQVARAGSGSCLAVLKTLGPIASPGLLSFCREGATLALDFPNDGTATLDFMGRLDAIVLQAGGRLYPAKDGRMSAWAFRKGYPEWVAFASYIDSGMSSDFWRRVAA